MRIKLTTKSMLGTEITYIKYYDIDAIPDWLKPFFKAFIAEEDLQEMILSSGNLLMYWTLRKEKEER